MSRASEGVEAPRAALCERARGRDFLEHGVSITRLTPSSRASMRSRRPHTLSFDPEAVFGSTRELESAIPDVPEDEPVAAFATSSLDAVPSPPRSDVPIGASLSERSRLLGDRVYDRSLSPGGARRISLGWTASQTPSPHFAADEATSDRTPKKSRGRRDAVAHFITFFGMGSPSSVLPTIVEATTSLRLEHVAVQWFLMQAAHDAKSRCCLEGQGGDEVAGGVRRGSISHFSWVTWLWQGRLRTMRRESPRKGAIADVGPVDAAARSSYRSSRAGRAVECRDPGIGIARLVHPNSGICR